MLRATGGDKAYSFFTIRTVAEDKSPVVRILDAEFSPPFSGADGSAFTALAGRPHFLRTSVSAAFPFATGEL